MCFFFEWNGDHLDLHVLPHSFPPRRSSDLLVGVGNEVGILKARAAGITREERTSASGEDDGPHDVRVVVTCKELTQFLRVRRAYVEVVQEFVDVGDEHARHQLVVRIDRDFRVGNLVASDLGAGGVITAACPPDGWELEGLALAQGLRLMLIAHQGSAFERRNNFAAKQVEHERSEERRDGKKLVSQCRYGWSPYL